MAASRSVSRCSAAFCSASTRAFHLALASARAASAAFASAVSWSSRPAMHPPAALAALAVVVASAFAVAASAFALAASRSAFSLAALASASAFCSARRAALVLVSAFCLAALASASAFCLAALASASASCWGEARRLGVGLGLQLGGLGVGLGLELRRPGLGLGLQLGGLGLGFGLRRRRLLLRFRKRLRCGRLGECLLLGLRARLLLGRDLVRLACCSAATRARSSSSRAFSASRRAFSASAADAVTAVGVLAGLLVSHLGQGARPAPMSDFEAGRVTRQPTTKSTAATASHGHHGRRRGGLRERAGRREVRLRARLDARPVTIAGDERVLAPPASRPCRARRWRRLDVQRQRRRGGGGRGGAGQAAGPTRTPENAILAVDALSGRFQGFFCEAVQDELDQRALQRHAAEARRRRQAHEVRHQLVGRRRLVEHGSPGERLIEDRADRDTSACRVTSLSRASSGAP